MVNVKVSDPKSRSSTMDDQIDETCARHGRPVAIRIQDNGTTHSIHLSREDAQELQSELRRAMLAAFGTSN